MTTQLERLTELMHARSGPLTSELLRTPSEFGLGQIPDRLQPDAVTSMVCGYCSTGCGLDIHLRDGQAVNLSPTTQYPVNLGMACPKGWEALSVLEGTDRATVPLARSANGSLQPVGWEAAMTSFVERFQSIQQRHGSDAVAFLSTGQMVTEEMAFLGALTKFGMGMLHGDGNTRQCMATSVVAYKQSFGFDAPPYTYADFEESDCIVLVGSNLCIAHPIMWERVMRNPHQPEIIVVDPRMTETAMNSTDHVRLRPKSDLELFYGLARILIHNDAIDRHYIDAHTNGFDDFAAFVEPYTPDVVAESTGVEVEQLERVARRIQRCERVSFWWTMGVNQSHQGVRTAQAIINLALMTGNMGRPGTGANSITGQCNAMGSRLFSNTTNLLGGHDFANPADRQKVASILEIDPERIPQQPSWSYDEIMEGILRGKIRGLWVLCTNTAHSWINQNQARDILSRLDFLVVQDMYHTTETAQMADLVLPAAGWGEKDGTFINSERRIGLVKKVRQAPGQALSDFNILRLVAHHWGCGDMFQKWTSPEAVFQLLKQCSRDMPCDIGGVEDYQHLDRSGGIQWPYPALECAAGCDEVQPSEDQAGEVESSERRLFADGRYYHDDQRARFLFEPSRPMTEPPTRQYPFVLLTGRGSASQWHTQTRTSKSPVLRKLYPEMPFVEMNPQDARELGVSQNEWVRVESQRGFMRAMAFITPCVSVGQLFIPMHYEETNRLTDAVFDPYSRQPSYKACAVRVRTGF